MNAFSDGVMARLTALLLVLAASTASAVELPRGFAVPAGYREDVTRRKYWAFDSAEFGFTSPGSRNMTHRKAEGHLWRIAISEEAQRGSDPDAVAARLASEFEQAGWTVLRRQGVLVARKAEGPDTVWISGSGNSGYYSMVLVQGAPPSRAIEMAAPGNEVESVKDDQDFPYALPFPGSKLQRTTHDHRAFEIILPHSKQPTLVIPSAAKLYSEAPNVSSYEFVAVYRKALEGAGWDVLRGAVAGDAVVIAHYGRKGRDVWLYTRGDGSQQYIAIADPGAESQGSALQAQLAREGHVALYGIYFDTDSTTPRPESEPTLQHVLALLKDDPALKLEVQGHTDNSGTPEHNARLSDGRAANVKQWLVGHGIAVDRLTSKGFGATVPVADNRAPEGRARNRRVELAKPR